MGGKEGRGERGRRRGLGRESSWPRLREIAFRLEGGARLARLRREEGGDRTRVLGSPVKLA